MFQKLLVIRLETTLPCNKSSYNEDINVISKPLKVRKTQLNISNISRKCKKKKHSSSAWYKVSNGNQKDWTLNKKSGRIRQSRSSVELSDGTKEWFKS